MTPGLHWGSVWQADLGGGNGRRPVIAVTRDVAIPYLTNVTVVPVTSTVRGIPTEVPLGTEEGLPAGFPVPPGGTVQDLVDVGGRLAGTITVTSAQEAYDFYVPALPDAGYTVDSANLAGGVGAITISGGGLEDGQLAFAGNSIAVQLDQQ